MILYIVRHGEPDYANDCLTEKGREQAKKVAVRLAAYGIDEIYSSPLGRAKETASYLCDLLGKEATIEKWTREVRTAVKVRATPEADTVPVNVIQNTYYREEGNIDLSYEDACSVPKLDMSTVREERDRVTREGNEFLERLGYQYEDGYYRILTPSEKKIVLFCHGAFTTTWSGILLHIPCHLMNGGFSCGLTSVTRFDFRNYEDGRTAPRCVYYGDNYHLEK